MTRLALDFYNDVKKWDWSVCKWIEDNHWRGLSTTTIAIVRGWSTTSIAIAWSIVSGWRSTTRRRQGRCLYACGAVDAGGNMKSQVKQCIAEEAKPVYDACHAMPWCQEGDIIKRFSWEGWVHNKNAPCNQFCIRYSSDMILAVLYWPTAIPSFKQNQDRKIQ